MTADVKQNLQTLQTLTKVDSRLQQVMRELNEIPKKLEASGGEYLSLKREHDAKQAAQEAMTKERRGLEEEVKTTVATIQEREKRLYAIKTQKEYQATLSEIAQLKQANKQREERVLQLLEAEEKDSQEMKQLFEGFADKESDFKKLESELNQAREGLEKEKEQLEEQKPQLLESLPPAMLKRYNFIKTKMSNPIAAVQKGVCFGCNINIPPQIYNEMLKTKGLRDCPNCHRLIYIETELAVEGKKS